MIRKLTLKKQFHPFAAGESFDLKPLTLLVGDQGAGKSTLMELIIKYQRPELAAVNDRFRDQFKDKSGDDGFLGGAEDGNILDLQYNGELITVYVDCEKHNPRTSKGEFTKEYKDALVTNLRDESLKKIIDVIGGFKSVFSDKELLNRITNATIEKVGLYFNEKIRTGNFLGDEQSYGMDMGQAFAYTMQSHGQTIFPLIKNSTHGREGCIILLDEPETALSIRSQCKLAEIIVELAKKNQIIMATHSSILMAAAKEVLSLEHRKWMPTNEFLSTQTK